MGRKRLYLGLIICLTGRVIGYAGEYPLEDKLGQCRESIQSGAPEVEVCIQELAGILRILDPHDVRSREIRSFLSGLDTELLTEPALAALAQDHLAAGDPEAASNQFLRLILKFPASPAIQKYRLALARSFRLSGEFKQALAQLESLHSRSDLDSAWARIEMARIHAATGEFDAALAEYHAVINTDLPGPVRDLALSESRKLKLSRFISGE